MGCVLMFSCNRTNKVVEPAPLNVENTISVDKEKMYLTSGEDYRWYETLILLNNYLDEENDGSIAEVVNIFQKVTNRDEHSFDTEVYKFQHFADGTCVIDSIRGFWVEDFPLVDSLITITYDKAFELTNQVNLPKPHSRHVCLRNPIGPISVNPQWVFGNIESQIWIDAKTGEAKNSDPAFPEEQEFKTSWP